MPYSLSPLFSEDAFGMVDMLAGLPAPLYLLINYRQGESIIECMDFELDLLSIYFIFFIKYFIIL